MKTLYKGTEIWINKRTGEEVEADISITEISRNDFEITYISFLYNLFEELGGKRYQVLKYILKNKDTTNKLIITTRELAEKAEVSKSTVTEALKILRNAGLITQRIGAIMLNPKIAHRGSSKKEAYLMQQFKLFDYEN